MQPDNKERKRHHRLNAFRHGIFTPWLTLHLPDAPPGSASRAYQGQEARVTCH